ncbi:putative dehydrogenase|uniref:Putative dehydrogenase n=1 Tax=Brenneria salicis ATCC 15712 = DSM 30166 TaxID=714314 RepID=A0A366I232_9GAMM|nr:oxidoreductase [Brenneria salicis]NMN91669.1 putative dehydrogenase [Brenneria salicis ATCC 15712 = DSM 30166]RBP61414.1 putative dehydrogenase [Brenneria salicis ATCC 15712 = DSM 30166]RLM30362.1 oxidoreductase [Brenneria salicis ATCC 15712 = DSM 30166]
MSNTIRVGLLGYGYASKTFHAPLIAGTPGMELAAISSSDADKVHADWATLRIQSDPQTLFNDPNIDLIVIPTPNDTHFPLARQALEAGKHVVVDKPFTVTLSQAHELGAAAEHKGKLLSVFHNRRWDSDFLTLKNLLHSGALGDVVYMESHFDRFRPEVRQRWREDGSEGSGIWYDLGPHLIDQVLQLFGLPVAIQVDMAQLRPGSKAVDYFHATLIYPQRRVALHASMLAAAPTARYIVHGTRGSFVKFGVDQQEDHLKAGQRPPSASWGQDKQDGVLTLHRDGVMAQQAVTTIPGDYPAYYAAIRDALTGKGDNPVSVHQAIQVMELIELGLLSYQQKKTMTVKNS